MWYVVQVRTGTEENIRIQCQKRIPETILQRCFIPYYEEKKRMRGEWVTLKKVLFPGYVFMVTEELEELYLQLRCVEGLTRLIGTGDEIVPISSREEAFLRRMGGEEQLVHMSEGIIEGAQVHVTTGPLQGMEGYIRKIDRHKRKAYLEVSMFGRMQSIQVGLEVVAKTE
ncbi:antiterminator LoaP [Sporofaciens sp. SGI.106]|uniref:antiterminator LoaP n=1 Tax=Sporofaciens sp. SGI.106 TaxID=3420568 RepID=UPI003D08C513